MKKFILFPFLFLQACASQQPTALRVFPQDLLAVVSLSAEPWQRLGPTSEVQSVLDLPSMQNFIAEFAPFWRAANDGSGGFLQAFKDELEQSRLYVGLPVVLEENPRILLALELPTSDSISPLLDYINQDGKQGHFAGRDLHYREDQTLVWAREGSLIFAIGRPNIEKIRLEDLASDTAFLVNLLEAPSASFRELDSFQNLLKDAPSDDALFTVWVPTDSWSWKSFESMAKEEPSEEMIAMVSALGLNKVQGFAWSIAMQDGLFQDTKVVHGKDLWPNLLSHDSAEEANLLGVFSSLPEDTAWATLVNLDWTSVADWIAGIARSAAIMVQDDGTIQDQIDSALASSKPITAQLKPLFVFAGRLDDLWAGGTGNAWIPARDGAALSASLEVVPEEFLDLLAAGYPVTEAGDRVALEVQGNRLVFAKSSAEEDASPLGKTRAFQEALLPRIQDLSAGAPLLSLSFLSPEFLALAVDQLQREGDDIFENADTPLSFASLPSFDALVSLVSPGIAVSVRTPLGLCWRSTTPFGYTPTAMIGAIPLMIRGLRAAEDEEIF